MTISVVIPTCNRNDLLEKCLENLHPDKQKINLSEYEVIVTDDNKDNKAKQLIDEKFPWVKWVEGPKTGPAANRNNGAKHAGGEWLIFTDDDCLPQSLWIKGYAKYIQVNPSAPVLEGKTIADREKERYDEVSPVNLSGKKLWSCNFAITKVLFEKVGGFDEKFPHNLLEDVDMQKRILQHSSVQFVPEAVVVHPWRRKIAFKHFKKRWLSQRYFARKYNLINPRFRAERFKRFITGIFSNLKELSAYSMKGWQLYFDKLAMNFCLMFL